MVWSLTYEVRPGVRFKSNFAKFEDAEEYRYLREMKYPLLKILSLTQS